MGGCSGLGIGLGIRSRLTRIPDTTTIGPWMVSIIAKHDGTNTIICPVSISISILCIQEVNGFITFIDAQLHRFASPRHTAYRSPDTAEYLCRLQPKENLDLLWSPDTLIGTYIGSPLVQPGLHN